MAKGDLVPIPVDLSEPAEPRKENLRNMDINLEQGGNTKVLA
jgi:hypothetical protein